MPRAVCCVKMAPFLVRPRLVWLEPDNIQIRWRNRKKGRNQKKPFCPKKRKKEKEWSRRRDCRSIRRRLLVQTDESLSLFLRPVWLVSVPQTNIYTRSSTKSSAAQPDKKRERSYCPPPFYRPMNKRTNPRKKKKRKNPSLLLKSKNMRPVEKKRERAKDLGLFINTIPCDGHAPPSLPVVILVLLASVFTAFFLFFLCRRRSSRSKTALLFFFYFFLQLLLVSSWNRIERLDAPTHSRTAVVALVEYI